MPVTLDARDTLAAIESGMVACPSARDVVVASGPGAAEYLHGQLSQNVTGLAVGSSAWSLLLSPQGRIDAWTRVSRVDDETYWLDVDAGFGPQMLQRLEHFKLRTKATFTAHEWSMIQVRGPRSPTPSPIAAHTVDGSWHDIARLWGDIAGFDRLGADPHWPDGVPAGAPDAFEVVRIRTGMPRMGAELGEKTIPAEAGIVDRSTDFTKGCYVGQELVARIDSRGNNTPRRVWGVTMANGLPDVGATVSIGGVDVGSITSAAPLPDGGAVALASIARSAEVPGQADIGGHPATITALPT